MNTTTTTTTTEKKLPYVVAVFTGDKIIILGKFSYESDALLFGRAYFAGANGGSVFIQNNETNAISAMGIGETWTNISEGANTDGFNG